MAPRRDVLLDTGPLVAYLDAGDQWHRRCAAKWPALLERLVTTDAVVTEACHLAQRASGSAGLPLEFLLDMTIPILPFERRLHRHAARLMRDYADLPMDYADASLVTLAEAFGLARVFTTDRRGFGAYRAGGREFEIL